MILTQISYLDCIVFLLFLAPQLLLNVGIFELVTWVFSALPHIGTSSNTYSNFQILTGCSSRYTLSIHSGKILHSFDR